VYNRSRFFENVPLDEDERQELFKAGSNAGTGDGRRYLFHNTTLQAVAAGATLPLGTGNGIVGTGNSQRVKNTMSMNNIYHLWKSTNSVFYQIGTGFESINDMTNGTTSGGAMTNPILAAPTYAAGNGWESDSGGQYALAAGTPGYDQGVRIANFNDDFIGAAPDVGAHEAGAPAMKFGIAASSGPSVPPPTPKSLVGVVSSKIHGAAGTFALALDHSQPIAGDVTVEPRTVGSGHRIVFQFSGTILWPGIATCVDASGTTVGQASATAVGSTVEVLLTASPAFPDKTRVTVALSNVDGVGLNASISVGFLAGDVNGTRSVTASDILRVKGKSGQAASAGSFLHDVDLSGTVGLSDVGMVRQGSGVVF
jgi:hypothetical protein